MPGTSKGHSNTTQHGGSFPLDEKIHFPDRAHISVNPVRDEGAHNELSGEAFASRLYYRACCFVLFFVAAAASFNGYYDKWHFFDRDIFPSTNHSFEAMVDGTAARPYVYRQLLPTLANWIDRRVPEQTKDRLFASKPDGVSPREGFYSSPAAQSRTYSLRYRIVYVAVFLFAWISVYAMYLLCKAVGHAPATAALSALIMVLLMPYFMSMGGYFYDFPELAFLALAVWMALSFDWWWMIPVVALAAWNKESFLFFIPALYPLLRRRSSRTSAMAGVGVLGVTCAAVYCVIRSHFQHNPGGAVEMHLADQIHYNLHPANMFAREWNYGVLSLQGFNPLAVVLIACVVWRGWRFLPRPIQRHAQIAAAVNIPLFLLFCAPGELRDLSMLYVTLLLLVAASLAEWTSGQGKPDAQLST